MCNVKNIVNGVVNLNGRDFKVVVVRDADGFDIPCIVMSYNTVCELVIANSIAIGADLTREHGIMHGDKFNGYNSITGWEYDNDGHVAYHMVDNKWVQLASTGKYIVEGYDATIDKIAAIRAEIEADKANMNVA